MHINMLPRFGRKTLQVSGLWTRFHFTSDKRLQRSDRLCQRKMSQMPVYFISHGIPSSAIETTTKHHKFFKRWGKEVKELKPKAMIIFSAHWETEKVAVRTTKTNHLLYDFYGFPGELYQIQYNSIGSENLANQIMQLLNKANIETTMETERGLDHGVWIPLCVGMNDPQFPIVQVSLISTRNKPAVVIFEENYKVGAALQFLRSEGVLIVGSGNSTHNLREIYGYLKSGETAEYTREFENNLVKIVGQPVSVSQACEVRTLFSDAWTLKERKNWAITGLSNIECLNKAHPSLEHLVPFHIALGAAGDSPCKKIFDDKIGSIANSAFVFGKNA